MYEIELWDGKSKKKKRNEPLRPVKIDDELAFELASELVQSKRVLCEIA